MNKYLGSTVVQQADTPYKYYTKEDWALLYILRYGGIDEAHHKDWVLDQVVRILNDAPIVIELARWEDGTTEYRLDVGESEKYREWVANAKNGEDGPDTYGYNEGITP